ncbi:MULTISPECIES: D-2-hydroxyacid dehydrogenase [unclassified Mesorhizobium]|uniref:D-2-hydroxyacid dehydrogenase n=1 Tax=unclassified Mesorhizobium TaxID=325217 RepID=UPI000467706A|nr:MULTISPECIES: D-2-hydroxyacid dehydrogenase [unclassified Mesorhizobium]
MSRPVVIIHSNRPETVESVVRENHPDLELHRCDTYRALSGTVDATRADVVYSVMFEGKPTFPRNVLLKGETVKWVSVGGSGVDHLGSWDPQTVTVTNAAGVAAGMLAEYTFGMMLSFSLGLRGFQKDQQQRRWTAATVEPLKGKTVLLFGLGKTGQAVARLARDFGMTTLGVRSRLEPVSCVDEVYGPDSSEILLSRADFVVCCMPLTPATRGFLNAKAFSAMKPSAVLIDISRGGIVDETALLVALRGGLIRGAALDVFTVEPLAADHPLWSFDNVIVTPHCASTFDGWEWTAARMFSENLGRWRRDEPLMNVVDPLRGY